MRASPILALLLTPFLRAQWTTVTTNNESTGIYALMPAGTVYDWGCVQDNLWSLPQTATSSKITNWVLGSSTNNPNPDPKCPSGLVLRVQQGTAKQIVQVIIPGQPASSITVPAAPVPVPIPVVKPVPAPAPPAMFSPGVYACSNITVTISLTGAITAPVVPSACTFVKAVTQ